jgi:deoxycytidylate deaminase
LVAAGPGDAGEVVGVGYNENPVGTSPCVEEKEYGADETTGARGLCYRDIIRFKSYEKMKLEKRRCPGCGLLLPKPDKDSHPWRCRKPTCGVNLELFFWPERAMTLCTAVHAEVQAVLNSRGRAEGSTLHTTTFPCFQCAEKIAQAKVKSIVFTEPYPDIRAAERLVIADIKVARFEGVRSRRFDEIFSRARAYMINLSKS